MKNEMHIINGLPVEVSALDEAGEIERTRLSELAFKEYEDTGKLCSGTLLEENRRFLERADEYILGEYSDETQE